MPKKIKLIKKVTVDAGRIVAIISEKYLIDSIFIQKGKYKIILKIEKSWNGKQKSINYLNVKKDSFLAISDGFFESPEGITFSNFNDENDSEIKAESLYKRGCEINTGGDGVFILEIQLIPIKKLEKDPYVLKYKESKLFYKKNNFNDKNNQKFVKKFLINVYYSTISDIYQKEQSKHIKKLISEAKKVLNYLKTNK